MVDTKNLNEMSYIAAKKGIAEVRKGTTALNVCLKYIITFLIVKFLQIIFF